MVNYLPIEYWIQIPKLFELTSFIVLGFKMYRSKKYIVNHLFGIAFFVWTIYTISDLLIWTHAADSETWFIIANRIRDIQIISAFIFAFLIFWATDIIFHGEIAIKRKKLVIIGLLFVIFASVLIYLDRLIITDIDGNPLNVSQWNSVDYVVVNTNITLISAVLIGMPILLYLSDISMLIRLIKYKIEDKELKRRMKMLIVGILLIPTGILWFTIILGVPGWYNVVTAFIGRFIWASAPIFIFISQRNSQKTSQENNKIR